MLSNDTQTNHDQPAKALLVAVWHTRAKEATNLGRLSAENESDMEGVSPVQILTLERFGGHWKSDVKFRVALELLHSQPAVTQIYRSDVSYLQKWKTISWSG